MNETVQAVAHAADSELPREERAREAARLVLHAREYRWVGIYDIGDAEVALIGESGSSARAEALRIRATVAGSLVVVPVLGAESAIVIGTVEVESDRADAFYDADVEFLEECAAVLRPLYD